MKKIILSFTLLLFLLKVFGQSPDSAFSKDYYLKKSKTDKTTGWVMLIGGLVLSSVGRLVLRNHLEENLTDFFSGRKPSNDYVAPAILSIAGLGITLGSIPIFISSKKNARRAATIGFNNQNVLVPQQNSLVLKNQPTLTLRIGI